MSGLFYRFVTVFVLAAASAVVFPGCGTTYEVMSSSWRAQSTQFTATDRFQTSGPEGISLQEMEVYQTIDRKLKSMAVATAADSQSRYFLLASAKIDEGKAVPYTRTIPQYGQTGGGNSYVRGTYYGQSGFGSFSGNVYTPPKYGVTGYTTYSGVDIYYSRSLVVAVYDRTQVTADGLAQEVWRGVATSAGESADLRHVLPYLVQSAIELFGKDSGQSIKTRYAKDDERLTWSVLAPKSAP